jgi:serine/threonine protein kinase
MGEVFLAEHQFLGRRFALKVMHPRLTPEPQVVDRMRVEAQAMGSLSHRNVVEVIDFWTAPDGRPCVVMELLEGRTLHQELAARGSLAVAEAVDLASQALSALGAAHALGIVHRDIKPENLFLHHAQRRPVLKVLDFGLARVLPEVSRRSPAPLILPTRTGNIVGTPQFMSPEGARGQRVDHRADLYSLGLVLYVMLAGRGPFDGGASEPEAPSQYAEHTVGPELDAVVLHSIREHPDQRHQSAEEFLRSLQPFRPSNPAGDR